MKPKIRTAPIHKRFSRLFIISTPFIVLISFIPLVLPLGYALVTNSILRILALTVLCAVSIVARKYYSEAEFRKLTTWFLLFAVLFLIAEFLSFTIHVIYIEFHVLVFYLSHMFWIAGYMPLIYACWNTLLKYSEYADEKSIILTSLTMFGLVTVLLVPISISISNSSRLLFPEIKVLAILYPYMDCIVLFGLLLLLHIYRKGKLAYYWSAVTVGILMFSIGDISNAFIIAHGLALLSPIIFGFFVMAYSYIALSLAAVSYLQWKTALLEPEGRYKVSEIFLVYKSGILIAHKGHEKDMDTDILSGMLTAVQDFIKDSFDRTRVTKERLKRLQYGGQEIEIEHGKYVFLALVLKGVGTERLHSRMRATISRIEHEFETQLASWDGNKAVFKGIEAYLGNLV